MRWEKYTYILNNFFASLVFCNLHFSHSMYHIYIWCIILIFDLLYALYLYEALPFSLYTFLSLHLLVVFHIKFIPPSLSYTLFYIIFFTLPPLCFFYLNYCLLFTFYFSLLLSFLLHFPLSLLFSSLVFSLLSSSYTLMLVSYIFFHSNICFS